MDRLASALGACALLGAGFVASVYALSDHRQSRNNDAVIKVLNPPPLAQHSASTALVGAWTITDSAGRTHNTQKRLVGVGVACAASVAFVQWASPETRTWSDTLERLGAQTLGVVPLPLLHTTALFTGSIVFTCLDSFDHWRENRRSISNPARAQGRVAFSLQAFGFERPGWQELRNWVAVRRLSRNDPIDNRSVLVECARLHLL